MKKHDITLSYLKIALAMAIVGSSVVVGKLIVLSFPIYLASELRFVVATAILVPLLLHKEKPFPLIKQKDIFILIFQALAGVFLFNIFMLHGLTYTTAIEAGIITSTLPAIVGIVSFIILKEKLTNKKGLGILFAVIGVLFINVIGNETKGEINTLFGNLLIMGAVFGEALFITLGKSVSNRVTPLMISTMMSILGLLMFLPFSIYEAKNFDFSTVTLIDWVNILYFGIVVTVIAFLLMYQGLLNVSASSAGVLTSVLPVSSIILAFFILNEEVLWLHAVGILFVFLAIFFISREETENKRIVNEN